MNAYQRWTTPVPVYVTRKDADGFIGRVTLGAWAIVPPLLLASLNAIGWGVYGLVELASKVV